MGLAAAQNLSFKRDHQLIWWKFRIFDWHLINIHSAENISYGDGVDERFLQKLQTWHIADTYYTLLVCICFIRTKTIIFLFSVCANIEKQTLRVWLLQRKKKRLKYGQDIYYLKSVEVVFFSFILYIRVARFYFIFFIHFASLFLSIV